MTTECCKIQSPEHVCAVIDEAYIRHWHKFTLEKYVYMVLCGCYATVRHVAEKNDITKVNRPLGVWDKVVPVWQAVLK